LGLANKCRNSSNGSISNLLNITPNEIDIYKVDSRKYQNRLKELQRNIFTDEPKQERRRLRYVSQENIKDTRDLAGNYHDPPNHEFMDVINTKNKYGFIYRWNTLYYKNTNNAKLNNSHNLRKSFDCEVAGEKYYTKDLNTYQTGYEHKNTTNVNNETKFRTNEQTHTNTLNKKGSNILSFNGSETTIGSNRFSKANFFKMKIK